MVNTRAIETAQSTETNLADLAESWLRRLKAQRLSPRTIAAYQAGAEQFIRWHRKQGDGPVLLDKATASGFLADLLDDGARPATARLRQTALRRFSAWLCEEGEAERDELHDMKPVTLDKPVVPRLDDGEMARMVAACKGRTFLDCRDMALLRLMTEGLLRASEALSLRVGDVDLTRGIALVRRGKGGRAGWCPSVTRQARRSTGTSGPGASTRWRSSPTCGCRRPARRSAIRAWRRRSGRGPGLPASRASRATGCGTRARACGCGRDGRLWRCRPWAAGRT